MAEGLIHLFRVVDPFMTLLSGAAPLGGEVVNARIEKKLGGSSESSEQPQKGAQQVVGDQDLLRGIFSFQKKGAC